MPYDKNERDNVHRIDPRPVGEQESEQQNQSYQEQQGYQQQNNQQQNYQQQNYQQQTNQQQSYQQQNYQQQNYSYEAPPSSNLVWAILTTLFCCMPLGIVSIVYASKVESFWSIGQKEAAYDASNKAKKWAIWAALSAVILWVVYFFVIIILGVTVSSLDSVNLY